MPTEQANAGARRRPLDRFLEFVVPRAIYLYARPWHRCVRVGPNPVPARGPALVIANHIHHADAAFLTAAGRRWLHFLQAREEYEVFLLRPFLRLFGCIPVTRGRSDPAGIRTALECLRQGAAVAVFPEGDLAPAGPGRLGRGKPGAALLALRSGAPVIPAFIEGRLRARGSLVDWVWPARGVRVRFGPPVDVPAYLGRPITHALLREVTDRFMRRIAELRPEASAPDDRATRVSRLVPAGSPRPEPHGEAPPSPGPPSVGRAASTTRTGR